MYVNASLIRELRMLAQHAFQRSPGTPRQTTSTLVCAKCIRARKVIPRKAITIASGDAVCKEHFA